MIKINLIEKKKPTQLPTVMGIDLKDVKFKPMFVAWLLSFIPGSFIYPMFEAEQKAIQDKIIQLNNRYRRVKKGSTEDRALQAKLDAFDRQVNKLRERGKQVDKIIKQKTNPKDILANISRTTPKSLWLDKLEISVDNKVFIDGASTSYRSVGEFINSINQLNYFNGSLIIKKSNEKEETIFNTSYRLQTFNVEGVVRAFGEGN